MRLPTLPFPALSCCHSGPSPSYLIVIMVMVVVCGHHRHPKNEATLNLFVSSSVSCCVYLSPVFVVECFPYSPLFSPFLFFPHTLPFLFTAFVFGSLPAGLVGNGKTVARLIDCLDWLVGSDLKGDSVVVVMGR